MKSTIREHKKIILLSVLLASGLTLQTMRTQAQDVPPLIIHATTVNTPPDNGGDEPNLPSETATVIYVKGSHIRSESKSDRAHTITIIDKDAKKTTNLTEANGRKDGYYSIDTPRTVARVDSGQRRRPSTDIQYSDDTKTIAGYTCKKAVSTTTFGPRTISTTIWYSTDFPLKEPIPMGGRGFGFGGFNQLKGFPLAFETVISNGPTIKYQVTKVEQNAKISDNEFDIPKGYDVKPESERPRGGGGFGGGGGFRGGNGGPGGGGPGGPGGN
jgi:GLPGLI family protein